MDLTNIEGKLSRAEMKRIMAGCGIQYMYCLASGQCSICVACNAWCNCKDSGAILTPCSAG